MPAFAAFTLPEGDYEHELLVEDYVIYCTICVGLVLMAGAMSGLTVGLLSISDLDLELRAENGSLKDQALARKLLPVIRNHHRLLVTLLLANSVCMESLPIFLDRMVPSWLAVVISTTLVLIFGEIVPQAVCTGRRQLQVATAMLPLVSLVMLVCLPVAYPVARILDWFFGIPEATRFSNSDLKALVKLHTEADGHPSSECIVRGLLPGQLKMIHGAIDLKETRVFEHMIPIEKVYFLSSMTVLSSKQLKKIVNSGFSRIPVFEHGNKNHILGILPVKRLALLPKDKDYKLVACGLEFRKPYYVTPDRLVLDLMSEFRKGKSHIAIVSEDAEKLALLHKTKQPPPPGIKLLGIITLEDIIKLLLKSEIYDEDDYENCLRVNTMCLASQRLRRVNSYKVNVVREYVVSSPVKSALPSVYSGLPYGHYALMKDE